MEIPVESASSGDGGGGWHLDKRVPLALIFAMLLQAGGFIWWAAGTSATVSQNTRRLDKLEAVDDERAKTDLQILTALARIEEQLRDLDKRVAR